MSSVDYAVFADPAFDNRLFANAVLAGDSYSTSAPTASSSNLNPSEPSPKEDISLAISKLSFAIDDVSKQIRNLVTAHHEDLLSQAASAGQLSGSLTSVRTRLNDLDSSVDKLRVKISEPYQSLQANVSRLRKFQQAAEILRRTSRFVVLARRLQAQTIEMDSQETQPTLRRPSQSRSDSTTSITGLLDPEDEKERTIAKAALSIAELMALLDGESNDRNAPTESEIPVSDSSEHLTPTKFHLRSIQAVAAHIPFIEEARTKVTNEMESMVMAGLTTLNQSLLASSLQTAYNLRILPDLVQGLVSDLAQAVEDRIRGTFDLNKISKEALGKDGGVPQTPSTTLYKSRVRTEPTSSTAPQWAAALWTGLEKMIEDLADCCVKVYTLEKVLKLKRDTISQTLFLDEAMTLLENKPSAAFWTSLSRSLEKCTRDSSKSSTFLQQTLSSGYPRFLRLFHEFFAKIAVHTDTVYIHTQQSPETVLVIRSLSTFESLYLSRSSNKLNEAVGQTFAGGSRIPPGVTDGVNIARAIANELDSAKFDPLLVRAVAKNVVSNLDMMISRMDGLIVRDRSAVLFSGSSASPSQILNGSLASCLYHCHLRLSKLSEEHSEAVIQIIAPSIEKVRKIYDRLVDPLLTAIRRELGSIIARLHRIDFGKTSDPMTGMGGSSFYMKDLVDKLSFIKNEILNKFAVGDDTQKWVLSIVKYVLRTFVLHVSITKPLSESGKLQLTTDMTELEFALNSFLGDGSKTSRVSLDIVGEEYRVLRAMRPLLFLDNTQLALPTHTSSVPTLIVLHHILVRSPLPLPHTLHGWQEAEYVRWVDEHSEEEARTLVEGGLTHWEKTEGGDDKGGSEYVGLARKVLGQAQ
ncbi:hypothetical protein K435DRAFT_711109 [Dendrothele bispora CBS 962.96]|uniref:Conserved oligomeric Golgi complex subunit 5 n=1 Tax=Dendrothele bispora (strain CBS 962.96) TaxID=1314807 RepID=A0A4S8MUN3_DENBC|nr:hypothetical protein K435DRAFT_711109 [Dendrothele bispora CBS 962.96]